MEPRLFDEERDGDAIYAIYMRKVRYTSPKINGAINPSRDASPDNIQHLQWETVRERSIKAGSLKRLFLALFDFDGTLDSKHFQVFFNTYRTFSSVQDVVELWILTHSELRSSQPNTISVRKLETLRSILTVWLDVFCEDFREPQYPALLEVREYLARFKSPRVQDKDLKELYKRALICEAYLRGEGSPVGKRHSAQKFSLLDQNTEPDIFLDHSASRLQDLYHIESDFVAKQLTLWDAELFKRVIPHQCLGYFWQKRNKSETHEAAVRSVKATIDQFNYITLKVMSTILKKEMKTSSRAKVVTKWIEVAIDLRKLKNYSSLKAVISGLSSEPVNRLITVWTMVDKDLAEQYRELLALVSETENSNKVRELLEREGTGKSAVLAPFSKRPVKYNRSKSDMGEIQGTVPYLGTFLTDLTQLDAALPDRTPDGLVNFDKRRKEFEILAKIKLFQSAANCYKIDLDWRFKPWFSRLPIYTESECFQMSLLASAMTLSTPDKGDQSLSKYKLHKKGSLSPITISPQDPSKRSCSPSGHNRNLSSPNPKLAQSLSKSFSASLSNATSSSALGRFLPVRKKPSDSSTESYQTESPNEFISLPDEDSFPVGHVSYQYQGDSPSFLSHTMPASYYSKCAGLKTPSKSHHTAPGGHQRSASETPNVAASSKWIMGGLPWPSAHTPGGKCMTDSGYLSRDYAPTENGSPTDFERRHRIEDSLKPAGSFNSLTSVGSQNQNSLKESKSMISLNDTAALNEESRIVRVFLDCEYQGKTEQDGIALYKSLRLDNKDKARVLISKSLEKHGINASVVDYCIAQCLDDGSELPLPDGTNAFYAIVSDKTTIDFILRRKIDLPEQSRSGTVKSGQKRRRNLKSGNLFKWSSGFL